MLKIQALFTILKIVVLLIVNAPNDADASNILMVFPMVSKSHFKVGEALTLGLARAGHNVTLLCPYPYKSPLKNVQVVQLTGAIEIAEENMKQLSSAENFKLHVAFIIPMVIKQGEMISNFTLTHRNTKRLMRSHHFDVVIVEQFCTEALFGLGQHFSAPVIAVSTFGASKWTNDLVGTPSPYSYISHALSDFAGRMSFVQRAINSLISIYEIIIINIINHPAQRSIYNDAFREAKVTYDVVIGNVALVLLNSHHSINTPRPYVPNMIEVGGMHVNRNVSELPPHIKHFIDSASDGVVYFSLGSLIQSSQMSVEYRDIFIKVFSEIKQKVVWKFEEAIEMPPNVLVDSWLPQNEILAHPNVRLFITHGGLLGSTESVYHGVPIIGIPFFGDQRRNIDVAVNAGWGLLLDYDNVTEVSLRWALKEVLGQEKFIEVARDVSRRYRDQPMTPIETAVYWTEYVIRHKGAAHLRSASMDLNWFEYHNVDVFAAFGLVALLIGLAFFKLTTACCRRTFRKSTGAAKTKTNTKKRQ